MPDFDTDKSVAYLATYERAFGHLRDTPAAVLELGVLRGGSLLLWAEWFPRGRVAGLDLHPVPVDHPRVRVYQGSQDDTALLDRIRAENAPDGFDIVIDDASHFGAYTAASFNALYDRHLKPGGIYVIEDWGTGYWPDWPDGAAYETSVGDTVTPLRTTGRVTARALPVLRRVPGGARAAQRVARRTERRRYPSHDAGMVGVVKQLVDLTSSVGPRGAGDAPRIAELRVVDGQVLCVKPG